MVNIPLVPIDIVFVLDKSHSMELEPVGLRDHDADDLDLDGISDFDPEQNMPATPEVSRWEDLHRVVEGTLVTFDASLHADLDVQYRCDPDSCG